MNMNIFLILIGFGNILGDKDSKNNSIIQIIYYLLIQLVGNLISPGSIFDFILLLYNPGA